ncbi:MAG: glycosyltransferase [Brevinema sp.]
MEKKCIFISYTNTGAGHIIPAMAIAERIEELYPNRFRIITSNFFEDAGAVKFNHYIEQSWDFLLKSPLFTKVIQLLGKILYFLAPYYVHIIHPKVLKQSIDYIQKINPDLIFTTHFFIYGVAIDAKKRLKLKCPVIGLNPDTFDTFPQWSSKGDLLLVCSELAEAQALIQGHKSEKLKIVPQALRKEFMSADHVVPATLRQQYGLRPDVFTIFMSDGGQGLGKIAESIKYLLKSSLSLNIVIICGKNESLYHKMTQVRDQLIKENNPIQLLVFSFVDSITPFIQMSDLFVGKSGPATIWECLKLGLPVLINFSANDAERKTAKYFIKRKVALSCQYPSLLPKKIKRILDNPDMLMDIKNNLSQLDIFQDGSSIISELLVQYLESEQ